MSRWLASARRNALTTLFVVMMAAVPALAIYTFSQESGNAQQAVEQAERAAMAAAEQSATNERLIRAIQQQNTRHLTRLLEAIATELGVELPSGQPAKGGGAGSGGDGPPPPNGGGGGGGNGGEPPPGPSPSPTPSPSLTCIETLVGPLCLPG